MTDPGPRNANKDAYRKLAAAVALPLFMQPGWLDIVCESGHWGVCLARDDNARITAALPYFQKSKFGLQYLTMPPITPFLGPWFAPDAAHNSSSELSYCEALLSELLDQLPRYAFHIQRFHQDLVNPLPFHWAGYTEEGKYTFVIQDCTDQESLLEGFTADIRKRIRKGERTLTVETPEDSRESLALINGMLDKKLKDNWFDVALMERVDAMLSASGQRTIYLAKTADGKPAAALYAMHDATTTYNMFNGRDLNLDADSAMPLLLWRAICDAGTAGRAFDFEGSMIPGIHRFFRRFGGQLTRQFQMSKYTGVSRILPLIR